MDTYMDELNLDEKRNILPEGTTLQMGKYRIDKLLSYSGFGIVYMATEMQFDERVAIKEFFMKSVNRRDGDSTTISVTTPQNKIVFDEQKAKFMMEAKRLRRLHNQHIVHITDLFEENGTVYYVMNYIDGQPLSNIVRQNGMIKEQEVFDYLNQTLDALEEIHSQKFVHLDIKPANLMVDKTGQIHVIDFALSKSQFSEEDVVVGYTHGYAPPEQMCGEITKIGPWTDLYALGATLYNLLTGQKPPSISQIAEEAEDAFLFPESIDIGFQALITWMMDISPIKRSQSVERVRKMIEDLGLMDEFDDIADDDATILNGD